MKDNALSKDLYAQFKALQDELAKALDNRDENGIVQVNARIRQFGKVHNIDLTKPVTQLPISQPPSPPPTQPPVPPTTGEGITHGAMTDADGHEDATVESITNFNTLAGKKIGIVFFSNNWYKGIVFPAAQCAAAKATGTVPFIRMQNWIQEGDKLKDAGPYTHANISSGKHDAALRVYAQAAKSFGSLLYIEYGVEVNGNWFPWSQEGPEPYKAAYRHIIDLFRAEGATNVKFGFQVDATDNDNGAKWYPGDQYIDLIGTSCYGAKPQKGCASELAKCWNAFSSISATKPLGIFEWGLGDPVDTQSALEAVATDPKYSRIKLMMRWHEHVIPGHAEDTVPDGTINVSPAELAAYKAGIANPKYVSSISF